MGVKLYLLKVKIKVRVFFHKALPVGDANYFNTLIMYENRVVATSPLIFNKMYV